MSQSTFRNQPSSAIEQNPLLVPSELTAHIGLNEAIFLQLVHTCLVEGQDTVEIDGVLWVCKTRRRQWLDCLPWLTEWGLRKTISNLRELDLLKFTQQKGWQRAGCYAIRYDKLKLEYSCELGGGEV